jgi:hypothetical protein
LSPRRGSVPPHSPTGDAQEHRRPPARRPVALATAITFENDPPLPAAWWATLGALYDTLFARLARRGFRTAVAGMTLPNDASVGLHRAMGFVPVETYRHIGGSMAGGTTCLGSADDHHGPGPPFRAPVRCSRTVNPRL